VGVDDTSFEMIQVVYWFSLNGLKFIWFHKKLDMIKGKIKDEKGKEIYFDNFF
jgi:hypothetical protein